MKTLEELRQEKTSDLEGFEVSTWLGETVQQFETDSRRADDKAKAELIMSTPRAEKFGIKHRKGGLFDRQSQKSLF